MSQPGSQIVIYTSAVTNLADWRVDHDYPTKTIAFLVATLAIGIVAFFSSLSFLGKADNGRLYRSVQAAGGDSALTQVLIGELDTATVQVEADDVGDAPVVVIANRAVVSETALVTITVFTPVTTVQTGEQITVTVEIENQPRDCSFLMYDLTLEEAGGSSALFAFVSPQRLGPPAPSTAEFVLRAVYAGSTAFSATLYGEEFCGFYAWSYRFGYSSGLTVEGEDFRFSQFLPVISR